MNLDVCDDLKVCAAVEERPFKAAYAEDLQRGFSRCISAGGEDEGYFAYGAGGRRFESCRGNYARVAQR